MQRSARLTLYFDIKPHAVLAYDSKSELKWMIGQSLLPISLDELVRAIQRFHKVTLIDPHRLYRLARKYASLESDEYGEHPAADHAHDAKRADAAKPPMSRRLTYIVVAFFAGLLVGLFGINMLLYSVTSSACGAGHWCS